VNIFSNPQGWPEIPLVEVATLKRGYDLPASKREEGNVPIYAANGQNGTHNEEKKHGPAVVTGRSGTIGKVHYVEGGYWPLNTALYVTDFHGNDPKWVYYMLKHFRLERFVQGAGVPTLNRNLVHGELIPTPPFEEQKRITDILDKADGIRRKRQQAIQFADEFLRSVFLDMFGDPVINSKGWDVKPLGEVVINLNGNRVPVKKADRSDMNGEYPYYGASGIIDYVDSFLFEKRNLLIGEDGANLLARSTPIAFIADGKYWVNNHAHVLGEKDGFSLDYLRYSINLRPLNKYVTGSAQPKLNQENLNKIPIQIPGKDLMEKFEEILKKQELMKENVLIACELHLFESLSQKAFSGELTNDTFLKALEVNPE